MYYVENIEEHPGVLIEHVIRPVSDHAYVTFPNVDSNLGPERAVYLAWVAEGNTPLPWPPVS